MQKKKQDKRAAALRENLRKRKQKQDKTNDRREGKE
jgi:hypothetical protein